MILLPPRMHRTVALPFLLAVLATVGDVESLPGQTGSIEGWGSPFVGWGLDPVSGDTTNYLPVGKTTPDYHLAISTTVRWGGLSLYGLLEYLPGISVYNQPQQWSVFRSYAGIMDQSGVPDAQKNRSGTTTGCTASSRWPRSTTSCRMRASPSCVRSRCGTGSTAISSPV